MKIGILIPSTSNNRKWNTYKDAYLYSMVLKSFLLTCDKEHTYIFYIGIDRYDTILDTEIFKYETNRLVSIFKNVSITYLYMDNITKGHLTVMWNLLFKSALYDNCDYFYQCGDDIEFKTKGWINDCIKQLQSNNNIGVTGPIDDTNNFTILTQSFVSRKHYDLFGYYFPEEIINWCCDDWINNVYKGLKSFYPLQNHLCSNKGGQPRYLVNNDSNIFLNFKDKLDNMRNKSMKYVKRDIVKAINKMNLIE